MGWFWGFGKNKRDEEEIEEVDVETLFGDKVRVKVTDHRKGSVFFRGKIKDKKVREIDEEGNRVESTKEYKFPKSHARRGFFRKGKKR